MPISRKAKAPAYLQERGNEKVDMLKIMQKFSKIGRIFSKIVETACIAGICGCAAGALIMLLGRETLRIGGMTIHSILQAEGASEGTIWAALIAGVLLCAAEWILSHMAGRYFAHELEAGTPFTEQGADELLMLGVSCIWLPIVATVFGRIARSIIAKRMENVESILKEGFESVVLGITFIIVSLIFRCCVQLLRGREEGRT